MNLEIPIKVEIRAQSSSSFTRETVEKRLADLTDRRAAGDESVVQEIDYLRGLRQKKWGA